MSGFLEGRTTKENLPIKRFGYLISAIFLIFSVISLIKNWSITPLLFLLTMYLLTGSLWIPSLIKPFYNIFGKYIVRPNGDEDKSDTFFSDN